ncbi:hypothetical protein P153DRAFT_344382 [Dothidotthia symphoricarpi CBS 119687]|uniref:N-acetyltransferase domain-containing protein n=1 Tax=Dothidotthia symphoricarpi CBS 119687 TaxID=1392245 RepID=A0A6A6A8D8_9PLEO|nr:uncharacterized protein P153DRAFT_344382 [Dothidotthia symphoricarpi CBS 119687]KAF2127087.1 hypothetical protein P153DRAFT_344382 [Dothidotthia symphoricarpi CBS 119687]
MPPPPPPTSPPQETALTHHPSCPPKLHPTLSKTLTRLEKKIFPQSEAFNYPTELSKKSIGVILAHRPNAPETPIGYLVYQRQKRVVWLHKLGVVEAERGRGVGGSLVRELVEGMSKGGAERILLWVDEGRGAARALYGACGFEEMEVLEGYYGVGRTAVKMQVVVGE